MKKFFEEPVVELIRIADVVSSEAEGPDELEPGSTQTGGVV